MSIQIAMRFGKYAIFFCKTPYGKNHGLKFFTKPAPSVQSGENPLFSAAVISALNSR
jgi:hypothetical protein